MEVLGQAATTPAAMAAGKGRLVAALQSLLGAAADGLEGVHSGLIPLRVRLLLEGARVELALGMAASASSRLARATALDYGGGGEVGDVA